MFVPKSNKQLQETLIHLNLCSERDFRRCRRRVRMLARRLPAFDFVWIDALVQIGRLTPFQAQVLESSGAENLCVGPYRLQERLGGGETHETFLASVGCDEEPLVLKRLLRADESPAALDRLRDYIDATRGLNCQSAVTPQSVADHDRFYVILSPYVDGPHCNDLLVRRGRFPPDVVAEIARDLSRGLAALESRGCLHGDIRPSNVRLTYSGHAVLVDAGIRGSLQPELIIRADLPPEIYDGIAPERIGTGGVPSIAADMYAFGCLLWQLLAGRSPFPTGDPLAKLAAHQSRSLIDVRAIAPETPDPLAEAIEAFTQKDPALRPSSFSEVVARLGSLTRQGERRLSRFRRRFDTAAPREVAPVEQGARFSVAAALALVFVLSGAALTLFDIGAVNRILKIGAGGRTFAFLRRSERTELKTADRSSSPAMFADGLMVLPAPGSGGTILLKEGRYEAEAINVVGDLTIRGSANAPAVIVVGDRPLRATCRKFALQNVVLVREMVSSTESRRVSRDKEASALMAVSSQDLLIDRCGFFSNPPDDTPDSAPSVIWRSADARDPEAGQIRLQNTHFSGQGPALACASAPAGIVATNCLKIGGVFLDFREGPAKTGLVVNLRRVTLRSAAALCRLATITKRGRSVSIDVNAQSCVFDLAAPDAALVRLVREAPPAKHGIAFSLTGSDSVIKSNVPILGWSKQGTGRLFPVDAASAPIEGLSAGEFQFVGPAGFDPKNSSLARDSLQIPRESEELPGIVPKGLIANFGAESRRMPNRLKSVRMYGE